MNTRILPDYDRFLPYYARLNCTGGDLVVVSDSSAVLPGTALRRWQGLDPARLLTCRVGYLRRLPARSALVGRLESLQDGIAGVMPGAPRGGRKLSVRR